MSPGAAAAAILSPRCLSPLDWRAGFPLPTFGPWHEGFVTVLVDRRSCLLVLEEICIPAPVGLFSAL